MAAVGRYLVRHSLGVLLDVSVVSVVGRDHMVWTSFFGIVGRYVRHALALRVDDPKKDV